MRFLALLAVSAVLAGCGGGESQSQKESAQFAHKYVEQLMPQQQKAGEETERAEAEAVVRERKAQHKASELESQP